MTEKAGFLGLGTAGGAAAGGVAIAAVAGVLYATGVFSPSQPVEPTPVATIPTAPSASVETTPEPAPEAPVETVAAPAEPAETPVPEQSVTPEDVPTPEEVAAPEPEATPAEPEPAEVPIAPLTPPSFDIVRAAPDGTTIIAGKGEAGSTVTILLDGQDVDRQTVDDRGEFVSFLTLPTSNLPRVLSLVARLGDREALSVDEIILAPTPAPQVAETAPDPVEPETAEEQVVAATPQAAPEPQTPVEPTREPAAADPEPAPAPVTTVEAEPAEPTVAEASAEPVPEVAETAAADPAAAEEIPPKAEPAVEVEALAQVAPDVAPEPETVAEPVAADPEVTEPEDVAEASPVPAPEPETVNEPAASAAQEPASEPAAVAVLRADEDGVELVQPATPDPAPVTQQIVLDTIGYSPDGAVLLSGRSAPDTPVRVYLNNVAKADLGAGSDGRWRAQLEEVEPGVYTLRLDALDADGAVLSRLETPFKRESPQVLAAARAETSAAPAEAPISQVTVQTGDTLWAISRERYGDGLLYVRVFQANRDAIRDPDLIYPGQIFTIPDE